MRHRLCPVLLLALLIPASLGAQATKPADIYPSNLDSNMYFEKYDDGTKVVSGINFMVLADGSNSRDRTAPFKIRLYLLVPGENEPIFVKTYETKGISHMGSLEFKDESVDLSQVRDLKSGTYRLGVYVDADNEIREPNEDNNATLFKGQLDFTSGPARRSQAGPGSGPSASGDSQAGPDDGSEDAGSASPGDSSGEGEGFGMPSFDFPRLDPQGF